MIVKLLVTDKVTGKSHLIRLSAHDAQALYKSLREIIGDAQYDTRPGQLVAMPDATIQLTG